MNAATAKVLSGREIAKRYGEKLAGEIAELKRRGPAPVLCTVELGFESDAVHYREQISKFTASMGVTHLAKNYPANISEKQLKDELRKLSQDGKIDGILIFSPLPPALNLSRVLEALDGSKDVEGRKALVIDSKDFDRMIAPPTALAAMTLILETHAELTGREALVIGRSDVVGKPVAMLLLAHDATVTICHSRSKNLAEHARHADILVAAVGKPEFVKGDWVKPGSVVIDVGDNTVEGRLVGDVEFDRAKEKAAFISPVPGGVGPLTNVMLIKNLLNLRRRAQGI